MIVRWRRCRSSASLAPIAPIDAYTFVDLGAGMGRAMLLAADYPFRAVVGVELHPTLARIARANLAIWRAAKRTRVPMERVFVNIQRYGNMSAATIPVALCEALEEHRVRPGALLLMPGFGGGLSYRAHLVRWGDRTAPRIIQDLLAAKTTPSAAPTPF